MITTHEILKGCEHDGSYIPVGEVKNKMIEFAQLHVKEVIEIIASRYQNTGYENFVLDDILSAYDLNNIK